MSSERPKIHFVRGSSPEECEKEVNDWIDWLPFDVFVININVLPMMLDGNLVFLAVVTYTAKETININVKREL